MRLRLLVIALSMAALAIGCPVRAQTSTAKSSSFGNPMNLGDFEGSNKYSPVPTAAPKRFGRSSPEAVNHSLRDYKSYRSLDPSTGTQPQTTSPIRRPSVYVLPVLEAIDGPKTNRSQPMQNLGTLYKAAKASRHPPKSEWSRGGNIGDFGPPMYVQRPKAFTEEELKDVPIRPQAAK